MRVDWTLRRNSRFAVSAQRTQRAASHQARGGRENGSLAARHVHLLDAEDAEGSDAPNPQQKRKFKATSVIDQGDDSECPSLPHRQVSDNISEWTRFHNDGEEPTPEQEALADQLTALKSRVDGGLTLCAGLAVWRAADMSSILPNAWWRLDDARSGRSSQRRRLEEVI